MRVDPYFTTNLAGALDQTQATESQLANELSSGVRVTQLSQDPVAAGQNVLLLSQIQRDDSFTQTASLVQGQLQVSDSALGGVVTQLTQALSLATQGNNGTLNQSQLQSISNQLSGIRDEVLSLANSSYQGNYIFAGAQTSTAPFSLDSTTTPATVSYNGDSGVNSLETPNGQSIQLNLPGNRVFTAGGSNDVFAALNSLIADFSAGGSTATAAADTSALSSALNFVSQQRVTLDNSLTRLTAASDAVTSEKMQLTAAQTSLMQADLPTIATQLSLVKSQQAALEAVIGQIGSGSLFDKL